MIEVITKEEIGGYQQEVPERELYSDPHTSRLLPRKLNTLMSLVTC